MSQTVASSYLEKAIETVEALSAEDQAILIEIVRQRLIQQRRAELTKEIAEAREAYRRGDVRRGTVAELMAELKG